MTITNTKVAPPKAQTLPSIITGTALVILT